MAKALSDLSFIYFSPFNLTPIGGAGCSSEKKNSVQLCEKTLCHSVVISFANENKLLLLRLQPLYDLNAEVSLYVKGFGAATVQNMAAKKNFANY